MKILISYTFLLISFSIQAQNHGLEKDIAAVESKVIEWRRDIHQHPELSNREFNTAEKIAEHLRALGIEVQTGVAHTGVVGLLKGNRPGKVVALRADIDALPVTERNNLPFKSMVTSEYLGQEVGVMHACGHDTHIAIMMGVAEVLSKNKDKIRGTIKFVFQPAEEGPPPGEEGGAELMVKQGVLENPKVDAIYGLHIGSYLPVGQIAYKPGGAMAAAQRFVVNIKGKQTHGSAPWGGVDPIFVAAKIVDGFQSIISREMELTKEAAVITVGKMSGGVRNNIIPESAELIGTIRTLDYDMQKQINERMKEMASAIAKAYRAEATVEIDKGVPITYNDLALTEASLPSLKEVAGDDNVHLIKAITGAEDFSFYQEKIPGFFFILGGKDPNAGPNDHFPHHTPDFKIDDSGLLLGVKAMTEIALDYLDRAK
ncbi:amidohydrolase [Flagellimonas taeanensis]|uniref:Amidohydrolase n=1 Tax=Flagellimonas taeanensis TaxID=1005926 RepID=A0A1M6ZMK1_9FLAO|nr:amidohydrolase [Allomuricauda taeanensis]SFC30349.1 amidohydrolase [Allomuricauda taeanensis]SHL31599.1 amidohydrolase [Allomuricauda taeanensis]